MNGDETSIYIDTPTRRTFEHIEWISEAWDELDAGMISSSFQRCGITSRNIADFINHLRHFMRTTELVDDVVQQNDLHGDDGAFDGYGDDCDSQAQFFIIFFKPNSYHENILCIL
jgi:hypothetical protein